jgi:xanthine dehydrogenase accessory factor
VKDFAAIWKEHQRIDWSARQGAIATVVRVHGSSYRSPGARMLITDDGRWVGSISGGCLEGDALRKARLVMRDQQAQLITYDTREESNQQLGIGLGCNGVIDVLIQPLAQALPIIEHVVAREQPLALATRLDEEGRGDSLLMTETGEVLRALTENTLAQRLTTELRSLFEHKKSAVASVILEQQSHEFFLEYIQPTLRLILFGAGFDARPVSQLAASLGWRVEVTDECVPHIAPVFFPTADKLWLCQREWVDRDFAITPYTACVLMSHNYDYDRDVLKKVLRSPAPYIGLLGPRMRFNKMVAELEQQGIQLSAADLHRIHSPIGLDIGAEAPDEIAVSIIAEIQSKFANRSGGFLKYHSGPIHQREPGSDQVYKQVYLSNPDAAASATR